MNKILLCLLFFVVNSYGATNNPKTGQQYDASIGSIGIDATAAYYPPASKYRNGMMDALSDMNDDLDLSFGYSWVWGGPPDPDIAAVVANYGDVSWIGQADWTYYTGTNQTIYCLVQINTYYSATRPEIKATYVHELGHCGGLAHNTDSGEIMYEENRCQDGGACSTTTDYVDTLNDMYN